MIDETKIKEMTQTLQRAETELAIKKSKQKEIMDSLINDFEITTTGEIENKIQQLQSELEKYTKETETLFEELKGEFECIQNQN